MSLAHGSLAASLVGNNNTVAAAATTPSPSTTTTTGSTATSRTRGLTTKTRDSATLGSTTRTRDSTKTRASTRTRVLVTRITGGAKGLTTRGAPGAIPLVGTTTAATSRNPIGTRTTPGPTGLVATKDDEIFVVR